MAPNYTSLHTATGFSGGGPMMGACCRGCPHADAPAPAEQWTAMQQGAEPDMVTRPAHYARFVIEPVTFVMANRLPYWAGNVIKYVCRAPYKHSEREDVNKALRYCQMRLEELDREANGTLAQVEGRPL